MSARVIRRILSVVFLGGVAGMIVMSVVDNDGGAVTFGLICAVAAICLIVLTSVVNTESRREQLTFDDATAEELETRIDGLVRSGADDSDVRDLVRLAVRLGRDAR